MAQDRVVGVPIQIVHSKLGTETHVGYRSDSAPKRHRELEAGYWAGELAADEYQVRKDVKERGNGCLGTHRIRDIDAELEPAYLVEGPSERWAGKRCPGRNRICPYQRVLVRPNPVYWCCVVTADSRAARFCGAAIGATNIVRCEVRDDVDRGRHASCLAARVGDVHCERSGARNGDSRHGSSGRER